VIVASLRIRFFLPECASLKQKRFVLNSVKAKLRNRFNVSVCESDFQDTWQRCELAVAAVATNKRGVETIVGQVIDLLEREHRIVVCDCEREYY
jgi:uncharacterized protein YlxP (DUF503 family)